MKKPEIVRKLARKAGISPAEAADGLDSVVREILARLRKGEEAEIPGLGRLLTGPDGRVSFRREDTRP